MSNQPKHDAASEVRSKTFPLIEASPGSQTRVTRLGALPASKRLQLQAYGLVPGRRIRVLQQAPVTVIQADHTELALESDLAAAVTVEQLG